MADSYARASSRDRPAAVAALTAHAYSSGETRRLMASYLGFLPTWPAGRYWAITFT